MWSLQDSFGSHVMPLQPEHTSSEGCDPPLSLIRLQRVRFSAAPAPESESMLIFHLQTPN